MDDYPGTPLRTAHKGVVEADQFAACFFDPGSRGVHLAFAEFVRLAAASPDPA